MNCFQEIIGQKPIKEHLLTALQQNNVSHAYLFSGDAGSGRRTIATAFTKALLCENPTKDHDACGCCKSCLQVSSGNHPDIRFITHEKFNIRVDEIRQQVNNDIQIKPYSSNYKIYIIPDANRMNEQAQNALLKTLEEPPAYAVILLLADNEASLLPTINSRCVKLHMEPVSREDISAYLVDKLQMEKEVADIAAGFCQGNIGQAIRFAQSEDFHAMKEQVLHLLKQINELPLYAIMDTIHSFAKDKGNFYDYLDLMLLWYRDILMYKATKDTNLLLYKDEFSAISKEASNRGYEDLEHIIEAIHKAKIRLEANVNFELAIELMLLVIKE